MGPSILTGNIEDKIRVCFMNECVQFKFQPSPFFFVAFHFLELSFSLSIFLPAVTFSLHPTLFSGPLNCLCFLFCTRGRGKRRSACIYRAILLPSDAREAPCTFHGLAIPEHAIHHRGLAWRGGIAGQLWTINTSEPHLSLSLSSATPPPQNH